jgi:hypothetical protein
LYRATVIVAPIIKLPLIDALIDLAGVYPDGATRKIVFPPAIWMVRFSSDVAVASVFVYVFTPSLRVHDSDVGPDKTTLLHTALLIKFILIVAPVLMFPLIEALI